MIEKAKQFCERLGIEFHEELPAYLEKGEALLAKHGTLAVDPAHLTELNKKYRTHRYSFELVLEAADMIAKERDMLLFVYTLIAIIDERAPVNILPVPDRQRVDTDFLPLFSLLWFAEEGAQLLRDRGVPEDIISDTLHEYEAESNDYQDIFGRRGMRIYVGWFMHFIKMDILRIGRLNFEMAPFRASVRVYRKGDDVKILADNVDMHEKGMVFGSAGQTDEEGKFFAELTEDGDTVTGYPVNEYGEVVKEKITLVGYTEVVRRGDPVISVHIPSHDPFSPEICEEAYNRAIEVFAKCYPDYPYKAIVCYSWLMEKRLRQIMGRDTNITRFMDKYTCFPIQSGGRGVYSFLFHVRGDVADADLPENNSMQKAVKQHLLNGGYFYEKGGVFFKD